MPLPEPGVGMGLVPHAVRRHDRGPTPTDGVLDRAFVDGESLAPARRKSRSITRERRRVRSRSMSTT